MDSAKSWRRRLPASIELRLALFVVAAAFAGTAAAQAASDGKAGATLDAFLADVHSLTAEFRQEIKTNDESALDTGTLEFKRPNRFRWVSRKPNELLVVADGKKVWTYDVELAQATQAPFDESIASSPAMLLAGDRGVRDGFDVVDNFERDGLEWIKLAPKADGADFSSVLIGFKGRAPQSLELVDSLNHVTSIELDKVVLNPDLPDSDFELELPKNVDVIGGER
ncbi:MAG TPA: outer membrane lipoprotein chaperone LolA [Gammaproteobacteria bacterium]|nr:outer membrane lipoprotein chaperone LolA [Gammaproteobacteria bacterium]